MQPSTVLEDPISQNPLYKYYFFSFVVHIQYFERGLGCIQLSSVSKLNVQYRSHLINHSRDMSIVLYTDVHTELGKVPHIK